MQRAVRAEAARGGLRWLAPVVACAAITLNVALRLSATSWWAAVSGRPIAVLPVVADVIGLAIVPGLVARLVARRDPWPTSALLVVSAAIMHVVGRVLVFGFRDVGLGVAWAGVTALVVLATTVLAWRDPMGRAATGRLVALQAAALVFVGELLAAL
jgi:hypothetical protein